MFNFGVLTVWGQDDRDSNHTPPPRPRAAARKRNKPPPWFARALQRCDEERFLDDCYWENQRANQCIVQELPAVPVFRRPSRVRRVIDLQPRTIAAGGECWKALFLACDHVGPMPVDEFNRRLPLLPTKRDWYIRVTEVDGVYHLARAVFWSERLQTFIERVDGELVEVDYPEDCTRVDRFAPLPTWRPFVAADVHAGDTGASTAVAGNAARVLDVVVEPVLWAKAYGAVKHVAAWYWKWCVERAGKHSPDGLPIHPVNRLDALLPPQGSISEVVVQGVFDRLAHAFADGGLPPLTDQIKLLVLDLSNALDELAQWGSFAFKWLVAHWHLDKLLWDAVDTTAALRRFLKDLFVGAVSGPVVLLDYGFLALRIVAFVCQDFREFHGAEFAYRRTLVSGALDFGPVDAAVYELHGNGPAPAFRSTLSARLVQLNSEAGHLSSNGVVAGTLVTEMNQQLTATVNNLRQLPIRVVPENTPATMLDELQAAFPEVSVERGVTKHPHPYTALARACLRDRAHEFLASRNRPVRAVGASNTEMPMINRLFHNCWPVDSGRTALRQASYHNPGNAAQRALTHDHRMENCPHAEPEIRGADIWSFFSAHDIPPEVFIREMAKAGSDTAVVALHLPFPLLDRRVTSYTDTTLQLHYERDGDQLRVYHLGGMSAGYSHDFETVRSWMDNLPHFPGAHVHVEVLGQLGTAVLFALQVFPGSQEVTPAVRTVQKEPFYVLPELLDKSLRPRERKHFAIPARKFDQLVAYVGTLDQTDRSLVNVVAKVRGMMAEIRVGIHSVEPRWSVSLPELFSIANHALLACDLYKRSAAAAASRMRAYYARHSWRVGPGWKRFIQGRLDLLTCRALGEVDPVGEDPWYNRLFTNRFDHTDVINPYERAGRYRLLNVDVRRSDRVVPPLVFASAAKWVAGGLTATAVGAVSAVGVATTGVLSGLAATARVAGLVERPAEPPPPPPPRATVEDAPEEAEPQVGEVALPDDWEVEAEAPPAPPAGPEAVATVAELARRPETPVAPDPEELPEPRVFVPSDAVEPVAPRAPSPAPSLRPAPSVGSQVRRWLREVDSDAESVPSAGLSPAADVPAPPAVERWSADPWLDTQAKHLAGGLVQWPEVMASPHRPRNVDFLAPLTPVAHEHPADDAFARLLVHDEFRWPPGPADVPCPTRGAVHLLDAAYMRRLVGEFTAVALPHHRSHNAPNGHPWNRRSLANALDVEYIKDPERVLDPEGTRALAIKANTFVKHCLSNSANLRVKCLLVEGPPRCAKSTLVRRFIATRGLRTRVIVPSRALAADWRAKADVADLCSVSVRQVPTLRRAGAAPFTLGVVDEVFNFTEVELWLTLRDLAAAGIQTVILVGDSRQNEHPVNLAHPYFCRRVTMHTDLGGPRDAHAWFVRTNNLNPEWYTTTGERVTSVYFAEAVPAGYVPDLQLRPYKEVMPEEAVTVGASQGLRARNVMLHLDMPPARAAWLTDKPNRLTVAVTRHTESLVVVANAATINQLTSGDFVPFQRVGARARIERRLSPSVVDDLFLPLRSVKLPKVAARLRAVLSTPLALDGHHVKLLPDDPAPPERASLGVARRPAIAELVSEHTQFSLPDPNELDFVTDQPRRPFSFRAPGPPVQREDVRNDIPGSHLLAAIHVNSSAFDGCKNLVDRQLATSKGALLDSRAQAEGLRLYRRFRECYYAETAGLLPADTDALWLQESSDNLLKQLLASDPLGETARTLTIDAEFKTQTKAKAQPGFAATLPYGQSILATPKVFNARFAASQPAMYRNLQKLMRPGILLDYGMTDHQLSKAFQDLGVADRLNGPNNLQVDISKQDSSYTAALCWVFALVQRDCGVPESDSLLYLKYRQEFTFRSRGADATRGKVSWNLPSGDPFTLIENDVEELCVVACRYAAARTAYIAQKGDDVHGWIESLAPHPLSNSPSILQVQVKMELGSVGYHAGRFHNGQRYLVDPVRAFLKHFTRLSDENVSAWELYTSYVSRATDYTDAEVEFLIAACQVHYPYFQSDQVVTMIETMLALRSWRVFSPLCQLRAKRFVVSVDTQVDCAVNCVRALRPGRSKAYYRQFRGLSRNLLIAKLASEGIPAVAVDSELHDVPSNVVAVSECHARVRVDLLDL